MGEPGQSPAGAFVEARPPRYVDALIGDFDRGPAGGFNHLGHWDVPHDPSLGVGLTEAQQQMNDIVVALAGITDHSTVLDVGCGFGGTLRAIDQRFEGMSLTGLEVDERQLEICRRLRPRAGNGFVWTRGDACAMPLADSTFDHAVSIEAMWHFSSRARFLRESARVLRAGGTLAVVDLMIVPGAPEILGIADDELRKRLDEGFAPWPEPHADVDRIVALADAVGLVCTEVVDASENTKPTYSDHGDERQRPGAAAFSATEAVQLFVRMHQLDCLKVVYLRFEKARASLP